MVWDKPPGWGLSGSRDQDKRGGAVKELGEILAHTLAELTPGGLAKVTGQAIQLCKLALRVVSVIAIAAGITQAGGGDDLEINKRAEALTGAAAVGYNVNSDHFYTLLL